MQKLAYSPREVQQQLGVSRSLCYKLIADGSLPSVRLGARRIVVPAAGLERFLNRDAAGRKDVF